MSSRRLPLALAALLCAPGVAAQAVDQDQDPGAPSAPEPPARTAVVDDRDPGDAYVNEAQPAEAERGDADAPGASAVARAVPTRARLLDDGRTDLAVQAARPQAAASGAGTGIALDDGRSADAVAGAPSSARSADDVVLDDGRATPPLEEAAQAKTLPGDARTSLSSVTPVRPNPVRARAELTFRADAGGPATVTVYDLAGRRVAVAFDADVSAGSETRVELDLAGVAAGTYVAVLQTSRERVARTFQVVR